MKLVVTGMLSSLPYSQQWDIYTNEGYYNYSYCTGPDGKGLYKRDLLSRPTVNMKKVELLSPEQFDLSGLMKNEAMRIVVKTLRALKLSGKLPTFKKEEKVNE